MTCADSEGDIRAWSPTPSAKAPTVSGTLLRLLIVSSHNASGPDRLETVTPSPDTVGRESRFIRP